MKKNPYKEVISNSVNNLLKNPTFSMFINNNKYTKDLNKKQQRNVAFSVFGLMHILDLELEDATKSITEGGIDGGIDAMYIEQDTASMDVHIFNFKDPDGNTGGFHYTEVKKILVSLQNWPNNANEYLKPKINIIEEAKNGSSITALNYHFYFVTSGCLDSNINLSSTELEQLKTYGEYRIIDAKILCEYAFLTPEVNKTPFTLSYKNLYSVEHKHNTTTIHSCVLDLTAGQLLDLCQKYTSSIFQHNVRNSLSSKINKNIEQTAQNAPNLFWLFNNGLTILCDKIDNQAPRMKKLNLSNPCIINGCQTATALESFFKDNSLFRENLDKITILTRIHAFDAANENEELISQLITCTNSQNPIILKDLKSRDKIQKLVQKYFLDKGVKLEISRGEFKEDLNFVRNDTVMQFYVAIFQKQPAQAKRSKTLAFNKYFDIVFNERNKDISAQLFQSYLIRKFLLEKEQQAALEDKSLLENADLALAYTMGKLDNTLLRDETLANAATVYPQSVGIIKKLIEKARQMIGDNFSYNNLFKNQIIVNMLDKQIEDILTQNV